ATPSTVNVELRQTGAGSVATMLGGFSFVDPLVPAPAPGDDAPAAESPADDTSSTPVTPPTAADDATTGERQDPADRPDAPTSDDDPSAADERDVVEPSDPAPAPTVTPPSTPVPEEPVDGERGDAVGGDAPPDTRQPRLAMAADIDVLDSGLSGVRVTSGDPSPSASLCRSSPCRLD
ncbi:MAG: hypothetical protein AAF480_05775, partial [Actinomycetota bacterium]